MPIRQRIGMQMAHAAACHCSAQHCSLSTHHAFITAEMQALDLCGRKIPGHTVAAQHIAMPPMATSANVSPWIKAKCTNRWCCCGAPPRTKVSGVEAGDWQPKAQTGHLKSAAARPRPWRCRHKYAQLCIGSNRRLYRASAHTGQRQTRKSGQPMSNCPGTRGHARTVAAYRVTRRRSFDSKAWPLARP